MAPLSDIVVVNITAQVGGLTQQGFGTPLILGYTPTWVERVRYYSDLAGIATDLGLDEPRSTSAPRRSSANPRPEGSRSAVGEQAHAALQALDRPSSPEGLHGPAQRGRLHDQLGVGATNDSIATAINGAISCRDRCGLYELRDRCGRLTSRSRCSATRRATGASASRTRGPAVHQGHAGPQRPWHRGGPRRDPPRTPQWYALLTMFNSSACVQGAATWTQANERLYLAGTQDSGSRPSR